MIEVGMKVKIDIDVLAESAWEGLTAISNHYGKDYAKYILNNPDKEYVISKVDDDEDGFIYLEDDFLSTTSFNEDELIVTVVYTAENGDEYSKESIESDIDVWMEETEEFHHLTPEQRQEMKKVTYDVLLSVLEWTSPYTKLSEFEEEDIDELFIRANLCNRLSIVGSPDAIIGMVDGKKLVIATKEQQSSPPHELTVEIYFDQGHVDDIRMVGLQYYDFSTFSMLIEVQLSESEWKHFIVHSWEAMIDNPTFEPIEIGNPYLYFNEVVRKTLTEKKEG